MQQFLQNLSLKPNEVADRARSMLKKYNDKPKKYNDEPPPRINNPRASRKETITQLRLPCIYTFKINVDAIAKNEKVATTTG